MQALPRQGPGNADSLKRALVSVALPPNSRIIDLGCGSGGQTIELARQIDGNIVGIDSHEPNIAAMRERVAAAGFASRIDARVGDMANLEMQPKSFDMVWSEGALYNLGLDAALPICRDLLKPGGYLVFTEAVWLTDNPPAEVKAAFADYPGMGDMDNVRCVLRDTGFAVIDDFILPEAAWWDDFYTPMTREIEFLRDKYAADSEALAILDEIAKEPELRRLHAQHFGYGCFVAKKATSV